MMLIRIRKLRHLGYEAASCACRVDVELTDGSIYRRDSEMQACPRSAHLQRGCCARQGPFQGAWQRDSDAGRWRSSLRPCKAVRHWQWEESKHLTAVVVLFVAHAACLDAGGCRHFCVCIPYMLQGRSVCRRLGLAHLLCSSYLA
jgi:hypothetical protein